MRAKTTILVPRCAAKHSFVALQNKAFAPSSVATNLAQTRKNGAKTKNRGRKTKPFAISAYKT